MNSLAETTIVGFRALQGPRMFANCLQEAGFGGLDALRAKAPKRQNRW
jgi:hypothetical protein